MGQRVEKRLLDTQRRRRIREGFSWINRRFMREGWIDRLERDAILVYLFLVCVADKDGLSFFSDAKTSGLLKISLASLEQSRARLVELGLIAYERPLYQVLDLGARESRRSQGPRAIGEALAEWLERRKGER